jgi:hypothetical protein
VSVFWGGAGDSHVPHGAGQDLAAGHGR